MGQLRTLPDRQTLKQRLTSLTDDSRLVNGLFEALAKEFAGFEYDEDSTVFINRYNRVFARYIAGFQGARRELLDSLKLLIMDVLTGDRQ